MAEDRNMKATEGEITAATGAARQRKKRKWDQPAESLIAAGVALPGHFPSGMIATPGFSVPGVLPPSIALTNQITATSASQLLQSSSLPQSAATVVQKLMQPKIEDELIAREIVINDAEPTTRYKLTKRQTQEEIQKFTGAVVITRGKYRPPNGPPDSEKPLYLHISAGAHLKDTAERIKAVDRAASMVEEILKQGPSALSKSTHDLIANNGQMIQSFNTCVFLGFDTDPSLNVAARIRGPNDQYINHIINETGATLVLRGHGSGNTGCSQAEDTQQPLHLFLSSTNQKSLEHARILAENLLDTICAECGATRISSCKVYGAVPPPQQFINGSVVGANTNIVAGLPCIVAGVTAAAFGSSSCNVSPGNVLQPGGLPSYITTQANIASYARPVVTSGTCYNGYGGIYPQATPLQQLALALRQAPALTASVAFTTEPACTLPNTSSSTLPNTSSSTIAKNDRRSSQRRKFQESPINSKDQTTLNQNSRQDEFLKPGSVDLSARKFSSMPPPKLSSPGSDGMPPPPPRNMPPPPPKFSTAQSSTRTESRVSGIEGLPSRNMPPPPPKFSAPTLPSKSDIRNSDMKKSNADPVPDTLLKLAEYGDEDDDDDDPGDGSSESHQTWTAPSKPFWAV